LAPRSRPCLDAAGFCRGMDGMVGGTVGCSVSLTESTRRKDGIIFHPQFRIFCEPEGVGEVAGRWPHRCQTGAKNVERSLKYPPTVWARRSPSRSRDRGLFVGQLRYEADDREMVSESTPLRSIVLFHCADEGNGNESNLVKFGNLELGALHQNPNMLAAPSPRTAEVSLSLSRTLGHRCS
jgi:hypothetical protein